MNIFSIQTGLQLQ